MAKDVTRRRFVQLASGVTAGLLLPGKAAAAVFGNAATGAKHDAPAWWRGEGPQAGFPQAFIFRQSEILARQLSYEEFEKKMLALGGFEGKAVPETFTVEPNAIEYFARFKADHPDKLVLLHINGNSRLPTFQSKFFFPGHSLFRIGTRLTVKANPSTTVLSVSDTSLFSTAAGAFADRGDRICATLTHADGTPDWNHAEELVLRSIDAYANTITVDRAKYGTKPLTLPANAYLAPHIYNGPEIQAYDLRWQYNYSTACPRDARGRNCADALVDALYDYLGPHGPLAGIDGLEFDVFSLFPADRTLADCNGDGTLDENVIDGIDTFVAGIQEFQYKLRERLGPNKLILADGGAAGNAGASGPELSGNVPNLWGTQPNAQVLNGVEKEGWSSSSDYRPFWSTGLNLGHYWLDSGFAAKPRFSYFLHKVQGGITAGTTFTAFRTQTAAAALVGAAVSFYSSPSDTGGGIKVEQDPSDTTPLEYLVWDELVAGVRNEPNWLGQPEGSAKRLVLSAPDLLKGAGTTWPDALFTRLSGTGVAIARAHENGETRITVRPTSWAGGSPSSDSTFDVSFSDVEVTGGDLTVDVVMSGAPMGERYPAAMGRQVAVYLVGTNANPGRAWIDGNERLVTFSFQGLEAGTYSLRFNVQGDTPIAFGDLAIYAAPDAQFREFEHGAVFANPSFQPYTFDLQASRARGRHYRRLQATTGQDPTTNDGSLIGDQLTIPGGDALFVQLA